MYPDQGPVSVPFPESYIYRRILRQPFADGGYDALRICGVDHFRRVPLYQLMILFHRMARKRRDAVGKINRVETV